MSSASRTSSSMRQSAATINYEHIYSGVSVQITAAIHARLTHGHITSAQSDAYIHLVNQYLDILQAKGNKLRGISSDAYDNFSKALRINLVQLNNKILSCASASLQTPKLIVEGILDGAVLVYACTGRKGWKSGVFGRVLRKKIGFQAATGTFTRLQQEYRTACISVYVDDDEVNTTFNALFGCDAVNAVGGKTAYRTVVGHLYCSDEFTNRAAQHLNLAPPHAACGFQRYKTQVAGRDFDKREAYVPRIHDSQQHLERAQQIQEVASQRLDRGSAIYVLSKLGVFANDTDVTEAIRSLSKEGQRIVRDGSLAPFFTEKLCFERQLRVCMGLIAYGRPDERWLLARLMYVNSVRRSAASQSPSCDALSEDSFHARLRWIYQQTSEGYIDGYKIVHTLLRHWSFRVGKFVPHLDPRMFFGSGNDYQCERAKFHIAQSEQCFIAPFSDYTNYYVLLSQDEKPAPLMFGDTAQQMDLSLALLGSLVSISKSETGYFTERQAQEQMQRCSAVMDLEPSQWLDNGKEVKACRALIIAGLCAPPGIEKDYNRAPFNEFVRCVRDFVPDVTDIFSEVEGGVRAVLRVLLNLRPDFGDIEDEDRDRKMVTFCLHLMQHTPAYAVAELKRLSEGNVSTMMSAEPGFVRAFNSKTMNLRNFVMPYIDPTQRESWRNRLTRLARDYPILTELDSLAEELNSSMVPVAKRRQVGRSFAQALMSDNVNEVLSNPKLLRDFLFAVLLLARIEVEGKRTTFLAQLTSSDDLLSRLRAFGDQCVERGALHGAYWLPFMRPNPPNSIAEYRDSTRVGWLLRIQERSEIARANIDHLQSERPRVFGWLCDLFDAVLASEAVHGADIVSRMRVVLQEDLKWDLVDIDLFHHIMTYHPIGSTDCVFTACFDESTGVGWLFANQRCSDMPYKNIVMLHRERPDFYRWLDRTLAYVRTHYGSKYPEKANGILQQMMALLSKDLSAGELQSDVQLLNIFLGWSDTTDEDPYTLFDLFNQNTSTHSVFQRPLTKGAEYVLDLASGITHINGRSYWGQKRAQDTSVE